MAPSKRKAPLTRRPRKVKTAQLRPRPSDDAEPEKKTATPSPVKRNRKKALLKKKQKPFRLLDLAPELRLLVYEKVLKNHPTAKLSRSSKQRELCSTSVLPRVSKQVRYEFLNVLNTSVPIVETVVKSFRFAHVVTFLNRLSDIELERMTSTNAPRTLRITLEFPHWEPDVPQLYRWLNRAEHPTKKGSKIDFQYVCAKELSRYALYVPNFGRLEDVKIKSILYHV